MAIEQFSNDVTNTLNGAIDNSQTAIDVTSAASFPSVPQFRIRIDDELMLVTGVSSNTFTVTRGAEGTTPASHSNLANVHQVLTVGALEQKRNDDIGQDTLSNRPTAGAAGRLFIPTNGLQITRDNGVAWRGYFAPGPFVAPPEVSNWSWVNQETATADDEGGTIRLSTDDTTGASDIRALVRSAPSTPYTVTAAFTGVVMPTNAVDTQDCSFGMLWRDSGGDALYLAPNFGLVNTSTRVRFNTALVANPNTSPGAGTTGEVDFCGMIPPVLWARLTDDGTTKKAFTSIDGIFWQEITSVGHTSGLTPNQLGFFIQFRTTSDSAFKATLRLLSWEES